MSTRKGKGRYHLHLMEKGAIQRQRHYRRQIVLSILCTRLGSSYNACEATSGKIFVHPALLHTFFIKEHSVRPISKSSLLLDL